MDGVNHRRLTDDSDRAGVDRLAQPVGRFAHVRPAVLGIGRQDVQSHKPKVVRRPEAVARLHRLAVDEPLHPEVGIVDRLQPAL